MPLILALARHTARPLLVTAALAGSTLLSAVTAQAANPNAPLYSQLPPAIQKAGKIQVVADMLPPYRISGADGRSLTGLDAELTEALEKQLGVEFETTIVANGPAIFTGIDTGRYDFSFGPSLATAQREKRYDMIPWLLSTPAFVVPLQHGFKPQRITDLCGKKVSVMSGSAAICEIEMLDQLCLAQDKQKVQQVVMPDQNSVQLAAQSGRADAFSMQYAAALYLLKTRPGEYMVQIDDTNTLTTLLLGMILGKDSGLTPVLTQAMQNLVDNGEYLTILDRWGLAPAAVTKVVANPNSSQ